ncbi:ECF transporter S component [Bacillus tianshenii]|nr:ECF transporter S component [Bacillus tianshenii]
MAFISDEQTLLISFGLVLTAMVPFFYRFERKQLTARELVLIALLAAIAAVSRVPFAALPNVQPTSFVIMMTGLVFGAETGFIVGATAALVSNVFLGQGPWTPWQMFGWGLMGLMTGLLKHSWLLKGQYGRMVYGFCWGFLFDWIMNMWFILGVMKDFTWAVVLSAFVTSFYFDLAHALSNVFFIAVFAVGWVKVLQRFKVKYGLLN